MSEIMTKLEELKDKYFDDEGNQLLVGGLRSYMAPQDFINFANKHSYTYHKSYEYLDEKMLDDVGSYLKSNRKVVVAAWHDKNKTDIYLEPYGGPSNNSSKSREGCFIATICYGAYSAPEVIILRKFRDEFLKKNSFGKMFVNIYYIVSPSISKHLEGKEKVQTLVRKLILNPITNLIKKMMFAK